MTGSFAIHRQEEILVACRGRDALHCHIIRASIGGGKTICAKPPNWFATVNYSGRKNRSADSRYSPILFEGGLGLSLGQSVGLESRWRFPSFLKKTCRWCDK
jgi:hypothetical protein